jgi:hypothetical protein
MIGEPFSIQAAFTRPANTTQYTAKDIINGSEAKPFVFKGIIPIPNLSYWIMSPVLISSNSPATVGSFKLLLFRSPPTVPVDHAVFAPSLDQLGQYVGVVVFDTAIKVSNGTIYTPDGFKPIWGVALPGGVDIFGVLIDDSGYTPDSEESFRVILNGYWEVMGDLHR